MNASSRPRSARVTGARPEDEQAIVFAAHVARTFPNGDLSVILANGHPMTVLPAEDCLRGPEPGDAVRVELTPHERTGWRLAPVARSGDMA